MPYVYMVRCEDRSLYTGIARDLKRRIQEHYYRKKPGAKYTKSHPVCSLAMVWEAESWSDAGISDQTAYQRAERNAAPSSGAGQ